MAQFTREFAPRSFRRLVAVATLGLGSLFYHDGAARAQVNTAPDEPTTFAPTNCAQVGKSFEDLIKNTMCSTPPATGAEGLFEFAEAEDLSISASCQLESIVVNACASGCPRYGYNRNTAELIAGDPEWDPRLDIHGSFGARTSYLKQLRNHAVACPLQRVSLPFNTGQNVEITLGDLLWHQSEMMMRSGQARFYNAKRQRLTTIAQITTPGKNTIDPASFHYLTWVTEGGKAHAMTQGDIGTWFLTVANGLAKGDHPESSHYFLQLARAVFRSFAVPDTEGGVRNNKRGHRCFNGMYCYWFHSRSIGGDNFPATVLNQHLHGVRDTLVAYLALDGWRNGGDAGPDYPLPADFLEGPFIDDLREFARGGLFQLAYASGSVVDPSSPPNLAEFLTEYSFAPSSYSDAPVTKYRAHYSYYFNDAKPDNEQNGGHDIRRFNNCHYHYHSVELLGSILKMIRNEISLWNDPQFKNVYYKLLFDRDPDDRRACSARAQGTHYNLSGVALAQLYRAGLEDPTDPFQAWCAIEGGSQPEDFLNGDGAAFLHEAYKNCSFGESTDFERPNLKMPLKKIRPRAQPRKQ